MKILQQVYDAIILQLPEKPPEIGGILGGIDGVVTEYVIDKVALSDDRKCCSYEPNINYLNSKIQKWEENEIKFMGIFHTHFGGSSNLSSGDKEYIRNIMNDMPAGVDCLWFPIAVLPERKFISYKVERGVRIKISKDEIKLKTLKDVNHL